MYEWLVDLIGYIPTSTSQSQNTAILTVAGFIVVMLFIITVDIFINGLFSFFRRKKQKGVELCLK